MIGQFFCEGDRGRVEQAIRRAEAVIAEQVGFQNGNYFARAFRQEENLSPSEFRSRYTDR